MIVHDQNNIKQIKNPQSKDDFETTIIPVHTGNTGTGWHSIGKHTCTHMMYIWTNLKTLNMVNMSIERAAVEDVKVFSKPWHMFREIQWSQPSCWWSTKCWWSETVFLKPSHTFGELQYTQLSSNVEAVYAADGFESLKLLREAVNYFHHIATAR